MKRGLASGGGIAILGILLCILGISAIAADPQINEFLASNSAGILDEDGEAVDWIEIYNPGPGSIDLEGWYLTDDDAMPTQWRFPSVSLRSGEYVLVFASGKDRSVAGSPLHANFKLSASGEFLGLIRPNGSTVACAYSPKFPEQQTDISYGVTATARAYFTTPTPGVANGTGIQGWVSDVALDQSHGFYSQPVALKMTTATAGATIRYTIDGSEPTATSGTVYSTPVAISATTCLRAKAFKEGWQASETTTQTYIFTSQVIRQSASPIGFPAAWGWDQFINPPQRTPADYEMDPEVIDDAPFYDDQGAFDVEDALQSIPTLSIVMASDDLFNLSPDPALGGIYSNSEQDGALWERPASVEMILPDGSFGFQIDCGIRIYGGMGRSAWAKKHTLRLFFRGEYGATKLDYPLFGDDAAQSFDSLILRANFNDGWHMLWDAWKLDRVQLIRDEWIRSSYLALGGLAPHGTFVHLYINGLYWGLYNPVERPDAEFSADYLGGSADEWDVLHDGDPVDGDRQAWEQLLASANAGLGDEASYQRIQGNNSDGTRNPQYDVLLDVEKFADYMLLNLYAGTDDWDMHNWYAGYRRVDGDGYQIYVWDGEIIALDLYGQNLVDLDMDGCPSRIFQQLRENQEFNVLFGDRVQVHLFNDGALTAKATADRYQALADEIDRAIVAESARWGDAVREIPYTRDAEWATERDWLLNSYFAERGGILLGFLQEAGLYPRVEAARFSINGTLQHGGSAPAGARLSMTAEQGTIYYTTDGTDPRPRGSGDSSIKGTILVPRGSDWEYADDGLDQGTAWRNTTGDWPTGTAEFGYGDGDETTIVRCGNTTDCTQNDVTTYYRRSFVVNDLASISGLRLQLIRDDGAVVYLNGVEVARSNMPEGAITAETLAFDSEITELTWQEMALSSTSALKLGENILAVEVHQWSQTSSDISFDLELVASHDEKTAGTSETGGSIYSGPVTLAATTTVKARVLAHGEWSALSEATYVVPLTSKLYINEIMAENTTAIEDPDEPGSYEDWIEIYNPSNSDIELGGMYLTDDVDDVTKYEIPLGTVVSAGGYILFWADNDNEEGAVHLSFALSKGGETVSLVAADGVTVVDTVTFGGQTADLSYGRTSDGGAEWSTMSPSPGQAND